MNRIFLSAVVLLLTYLSSGYAPAADLPVIREVVASPDSGGVRVVIRADGPLTFRSYLMPELAKWVIDLPEAISAHREDESKKMRIHPLERITVRQKEVNGDRFTRMGFDFVGEVEFSIKVDPVDKGRLLVFLKPLKAPTPNKPLTVPGSFNR